MSPYTLLWLTLSKAEAGISYLTDSAGLRYQVYVDGSSSGAFLEASYTWAVAASTSSGGTSSMFLNDMFDGYGEIFVDGRPYRNNGSATLDCDDRQLVMGTQTEGDLSFWRTIYVPDDDTFARSVMFVTNNGTKDYSTLVGLSGNLGSDSSTVVIADSSGDKSIDLSDDWAVSMQGFYAGTSSDPRIGHLWQNGVGDVVADEITLSDSIDTFHWRFSMTIAPGETIAILTFVTGQPNIAAAQLQMETLIGLPDAALACMTEDEIASVINFGVDCRHLDDQCNAGEYDEKLKTCVTTPANEAGKCDDGLACTLDDVCGAGTCAGIETPEVTGDGIDQDCDVGEICFSDLDDDGHAADDGATVASADVDCDDPGEATSLDPADDCDDDNADAYPGGTEIANDGVDQDCNGKDLIKKTGGDDTGGGDDAGGDDAGAGDDGDGDGSDNTDEDDGGCSCAAGSAPTPLSALVLLGVVGLFARRRR
jgi:MYXO-CTERM domain-containing protein